MKLELWKKYNIWTNLVSDFLVSRHRWHPHMFWCSNSLLILNLISWASLKQTSSILFTCFVNCQTFQRDLHLGHHLRWRCTDIRHGQTEAVLHYDWTLALPPQGWFWSRGDERWMNILTQNHLHVGQYMSSSHRHNISVSLFPFELLTSRRSGPAGFHHVLIAWTHWYVSSPPSSPTQNNTRRLFWRSWT